MAVSVSVLPTTATKLSGQTQLIVPTVLGFATLNTVTWSIVSGSGTVSAGGLFTANLNGATVVRATSVEDVTKHADCTVTVHAVVQLTPATKTVNPGDTVQIAKNILGVTSSAVSYVLSSGAGAVTSGGLYSAGLVGTDVVTVTSVEDSAASATFTATVAKVASGARRVHLLDSHNEYAQNALLEKMTLLDRTSAEYALAKAALDALAVASAS